MTDKLYKCRCGNRFETKLFVQENEHGHKRFKAYCDRCCVQTEWMESEKEATRRWNQIMNPCGYEAKLSLAFIESNKPQGARIRIVEIPVPGWVDGEGWHLIGRLENERQDESV